MSQYYEDAKEYANIIRDKNRLKAQIAGISETVQIGKTHTDYLNVVDFNLVIQRRNVSLDTRWQLFSWGEADWDGTVSTTSSFVLSHALLGILGTSQLGENKGTWSEVSRYMWIWNDNTELTKGTADANIDLTNGDIRLAI